MNKTAIYIKKKKSQLQQFFPNIMIRIVLNKYLILSYCMLITLFSYPAEAKNINQDSLIVKGHQSIASDSNKVSTKSPRTALICALAFPGLGQFYNGKKFKSLLFFCTEFSLLANSIYLNQKYKEWDKKYKQNEPGWDPKVILDNNCTINRY